MTSKTSKIILKNVTIKDCAIGIDLHTNTNAEIIGMRFINNSQAILLDECVRKQIGNVDKSLSYESETLRFCDVSFTNCKNSVGLAKKYTDNQNLDDDMETESYEIPTKEISFNDSSVICIDD